MKMSTDRKLIKVRTLRLGDQLLVDENPWEVLHIETSPDGNFYSVKIGRGKVQALWPTDRVTAHGDQIIAAIPFRFTDEQTGGSV